MKKTILLKSLLLSVFLSPSLMAGEGTCKKETPQDFCKDNKAICKNAIKLKRKVNFQLKRLEKEFAQKGEELKVVFIGRMGTDPGSSLVLSDYNPNTGDLFQSLADYRQFADEAGEDSEKALEALSSEKRRIRYSHFGIAIKGHFNENPEEPWTIIHLLRSCQNPIPNLYTEHLLKFFLDSPDDFGSQLIVPKPEVQNRVENFLLKEKGGYFLMSSFYNLLAEWDDNQEHNSVNWPTEVLAASQMPRGWLFEQLKEKIGPLPLDIDRLLDQYEELKDQQNQLRREWGVKYANTHTDTFTPVEDLPWEEQEIARKKEELQQKMEAVEADLQPYYEIFHESRTIVQSVLRDSGYRPTRLLLKGKVSWAGNFLVKAFIPDYIAFRKDNNSGHSLARGNTMMSFREYAVRNNLVEMDLVNGIVDIYLDPKDRFGNKPKKKANETTHHYTNL